MQLDGWLASRDGVAHTSEIYSAGFSRHAVDAAIANGRMQRVRRSWISLHPGDDELLAAVAAGGRLTCISAARRLGLWSPAPDAHHLAVPAGAGRTRCTGIRVHWSRGPAPVHRRQTVDPLINVLHHVARCQEAPVALAIWESALNRRLIGAGVLERVAWQGLRARRLAGVASSLSDSGLETEFLLLMRSIGVVLRQQVRIDGRAVDALIGQRLVVQLDGFAHHSDPASRRRDIDADARLRLRGYTVLRFDFHQIFFMPDLVADIVRTALAQRLHVDG
nr:DUF559 domain-containing protein [Microbacterium hydrocarbonoxydans]